MDTEKELVKLNQNKMKTAIQLAIEKIDEQIEIAQVSKTKASKVKDATSMNRHHGMKVALVSFKQDLIQLLEREKEIIRTAYLDGMDGEYNTSEQYYNETFKSE